MNIVKINNLYLQVAEGDAKHPQLLRRRILWRRFGSSLNLVLLLLHCSEPVAGRSGLSEAHILGTIFNGLTIFLKNDA